MENVAELMGALFNSSLVIMIVATMFAAGLLTTTKALGSGASEAIEAIKQLNSQHQQVRAERDSQIEALQAEIAEMRRLIEPVVEQSGHELPSVVPLMRTAFVSDNVTTLARASAARKGEAFDEAADARRAAEVDLRGLVCSVCSQTPTGTKHRRGYQN